MHKALMCILGGVLGFHADALTISPTIIEMSTQSRATAQIRLENSSSKQTSIEVSVRHLVFDRDGNFTVEDTENAELVVFPPAAVLEVGGVQVFRLQWLGKGNLPKSESFFVRFTQPALEPFDNPDSWDKSAGSALAIEIHYNALVHVSSPGQQAEITLRIRGDKATLSNHGNRYTFLSRLRFIQNSQNVIEVPETIFGERFLSPSSSVVLDVPTFVTPGAYVGEPR